MLNNFKRALVLAPHTDDGEFGCGGTIAKLCDMGVEVFYCAFSACENSVPEGWPKDILEHEVRAATSVLGINSSNLILLSFQVRTFNFHRQEILDEIIKLRTMIKPDLVFMPSIKDIHQDHFTITNEGIRAFKFSSIFCYEMPWNNFVFNTTAFVELGDDHLKKKIAALDEYKSQKQRPYANEEFIKSLSIVRGTQVGKKYAEVFEVVRMVL